MSEQPIPQEPPPQEPPHVSADTPNWSRERRRGGWDPGRRLLRAIRRHQALAADRRPQAALLRRYWVLQHWFWSVLAQAEIPLACEIGGGLLLPHPNGIVVHRHARIGPNCLIFQQVTIGTVASRPGAPVIGGHVDIGAGAKILGPVTVGDHAVIGANAVVTRDVPRGGVVVGVPGRVVRIREGV